MTDTNPLNLTGAGLREVASIDFQYDGLAEEYGVEMLDQAWDVYVEAVANSTLRADQFVTSTLLKLDSRLELPDEVVKFVRVLASAEFTSKLVKKLLNDHTEAA